ncbi:hypothetical protein BU23DRAFT_15727 [Bimuria novae-zelandiae CBS 107.79]|uniref:Uncharacterized protein n=1 Tax=Bimuria novae-zelandiae CBS 107.79 TaxID=1447943 RepID=A0A6A5VJW6_9PLEO|nr:hypothetical protein BU23DRAFT_15727 [Bimuria novae-zelandiae CBS 107.79]
MLPSSNLSEVVSTILTQSLSAETSAAPVGSASVFSGAQHISLSGAAAIIRSTGTAGFISPTANLTTSAAASLSPSPCANVTSISEDEFSNSLMDRTRRPHTSTPVGTAPLVTAFGESDVSAPAANSTIPPPPPFIPNNGYGAKSSSEVAITEQPPATILPIVANSSAAFPTASGSVEQPSVTLPPLLANSSAAFPTASGSTVPDFENEFGDRIGRF